MKEPWAAFPPKSRIVRVRHHPHAELLDIQLEEDVAAAVFRRFHRVMAEVFLDFMRYPDPYKFYRKWIRKTYRCETLVED